MPLFQDNLSPYLTAVEQGSTPANPASGNQKLFIRTSDHALCYLNSSGTVTPLAAANPMTTQDDIIVGGSSGVPGRLAKGTDGQVLTVDPSTHHLLWATPIAAVQTTKGDLAGYSTVPARIPIGSDTQVLTADSTQTLGLKWAAGGGGGGSPFSLDTIALAATYGDEFDGTSLNARWTAAGDFVPHALDYGIGGSWIQWTQESASPGGIYQSGPSKDIFELIGAFSKVGGGGNMALAIVSSTGAGVLAYPRADTTHLCIDLATSYVYSGDGANATLAANAWTVGAKFWVSFRQFKTALDGIIYFARFSLDGNTWSVPVYYKPSSFTYAKIGVGNLANVAVLERPSIDRFNIINALNLGNNLAITPTSGTCTATASSSTGGFVAAHGNDGTSADWAMNAPGSPTYFLLTWSAGQSLNRVAIKERSGDAFGYGHLELNDGATTTYVRIATKMAGSGTLWHLVEFPTLTGITTCNIVSDSGASGNGGFIEVEAYLAS